MYAIIKTGGKQYRVAIGDTIDVELLLGLEAGASFNFDEVLFVYDGKETHVGSPLVGNFLVSGEVLGEAKGEKIHTLKYKRRKNECKQWGHRQRYTRVKITEIGNQRKEK